MRCVRRLPPAERCQRDTSHSSPTPSGFYISAPKPGLKTTSSASWMKSQVRHFCFKHVSCLTLKAVKYFIINHGEQRFFSI